MYASLGRCLVVGKAMTLAGHTPGLASPVPDTMVGISLVSKLLLYYSLTLFWRHDLWERIDEKSFVMDRGYLKKCLHYCILALTFASDFATIPQAYVCFFLIDCNAYVKQRRKVYPTRSIFNFYLTLGCFYLKAIQNSLRSALSGVTNRINKFDQMGFM